MIEGAPEVILFYGMIAGIILWAFFEARGK
jgi:hypothetical protein